jgi:hypothetical protein
MNNKVIISVVVVIILLASVGIGTYLVLNRQGFFSNAQQTANSTSTSGSSSCPAPGTPATVTLSYPFCDSGSGGSESCNFEKAGCVWESVSGSTKYSVKVTEVETGATIATDTINAPTTKTSFPVVQGRTYKCEVSAVNSCGATGGTNEDTLLCETDAFVSPAPSAIPPVVGTPISVAPPPPVVIATPPPVACGAPGCSTTVPCDNGFICVQTSVGQNYCARSEYQSQCYRSPNGPSCCEAPPAPAPTLPPAGVLDTTLIIGGAGIGLVILGAAALLLL